MIDEKKIRMARLHICCFENFDDKRLKYDLEKFPDRLCVIDEDKDIVVDVETRHQYTYVRTISMLYFLNELERKKISVGKRVGCFEYDSLSLGILSSDDLKECKEIINLLKQGFVFPDGNEELSNEEYLELINRSKIEEEPKKRCKTRKKRK